MTRILYLDTETFSETPLSAGTHRYAESAEVMVATYAFNEDPVSTLEFPARGDIDELIEEADVVVGHNFGMFDRTVLRHALGVVVPVAKIFDTMVCALSHSLPGSLGTLCDVMGITGEDAKDKEGKALIQLFCKPRPKTSKLRRATKETHPEEWARFLAYAGRDITSMRALYKKLPRWNYDMGKPEHVLWQLDQEINDRGVPVDQLLARGALNAVAIAKDILAARTQEMTNGEVQAATQRDAMLKHLLGQYGITLPDMQKGTLERRIEDPDLPEPVRELLAIRLSASSTSVTKYQRLLDAVSADGRLRGTLQFCGAARTGRWAGRLFQPQNLPRPTLEQPEIDDSIRAFHLGCAEIVLPDIIEAAQSAIRGSLVASPGKKLVVADLANIEGRVLAWLAGEDWKLQAFRDYDAGEGPDLYKVTAGRILNKQPEAVTKDERQSSGKVPELACGYQGAAGAFASMAQLYGLVLEHDEVIRIVKQWRKAHPATVKFWYAMEDAAKGATGNPGVVFEYSRIQFKRDGAWLKMRLPSGRLLCYPAPKVEDVKSPCQRCGGDGVVWTGDPAEIPFSSLKGLDETETCSKCSGSGHVWRAQLTYAGINQYSRKWERLKTYGGKLAENATQAVARDVIAGGLENAAEAHFQPLLTVHDEIITEVTLPTMGDDVEDLCACMTAARGRLAWTAGLPLAAEGFEATRYRK